MSNTSIKLVTLLDKTCTRCKITKAASEFYKDRKCLSSRCKKCRSELTKEYIKSLPKEVFRARREKYNGDYNANANYKRFYGLSLEIVRKMLTSQDGRCANKNCNQEIFIGRGVASKNKANLDHCHTTGKVRGVICVPCNTYLGMLEAKNRVVGLIKYLKSHGQMPEYTREIE